MANTGTFIFALRDPNRLLSNLVAIHPLNSKPSKRGFSPPFVILSSWGFAYIRTYNKLLQAAEQNLILISSSQFSHFVCFKQLGHGDKVFLEERAEGRPPGSAKGCGGSWSRSRRGGLGLGHAVRVLVGHRQGQAFIPSALTGQRPRGRMHMRLGVSILRVGGTEG